MTLTDADLKEAAELMELDSKRPIAGRAGYFVTAAGRIISEIPWRGQTLRVLKPCPSSHGYLRVKFIGGQTGFIHKIVCAEFHGPKPTPAHQVRHLNGIRSDNRSTNLLWGTAKENAADRELHGNSKGKLYIAKAWAASLVTFKAKTHCKSLHPLALNQNTGRRYCPTCAKERNLAYYHRRGKYLKSAALEFAIATAQERGT